MKKITINALVDIGGLITFIPVLISGLVIYLVLPSGSGKSGVEGVYLGLAREEWLNMHNYTSLVFTVLLILHLCLHWRFFRNIKKCILVKEKAPCNDPEQ